MIKSWQIWSITLLYKTQENIWRSRKIKLRHITKKSYKIGNYSFLLSILTASAPDKSDMGITKNARAIWEGILNVVAPLPLDRGSRAHPNKAIGAGLHSCLFSRPRGFSGTVLLYIGNRINHLSLSFYYPFLVFLSPSYLRVRANRLTSCDS